MQRNTTYSHAKSWGSISGKECDPLTHRSLPGRRVRLISGPPQGHLSNPLLPSWFRGLRLSSTITSGRGRGGEGREAPTSKAPDGILHEHYCGWMRCCGWRFCVVFVSAFTAKGIAFTYFATSAPRRPVLSVEKQRGLAVSPYLDDMIPSHLIPSHPTHPIPSHSILFHPRSRTAKIIYSSRGFHLPIPRTLATGILHIIS